MRFWGNALEPTHSTYEFGDFTLDPAQGCLLRAGQQIRLRPKVFETLKYLVEHAGRLIAKQELMEAVWPDAYVTDDSLVQCTLELRRALDDRGQLILKTVPRRGYLFAAPVAEKVSPNSGGLSSDSRFLGSSPLAPRRPRDLPVARTSLVGRERQVWDAAELLQRSDVRLLSLTGAGGSGKTRLGLAVAEAVAETFPGGAKFVALASITNYELVTNVVAEALGIQHVANRTVAESIREHLRDSGAFLLILDNFEHVLSASTFVANLLEACANLKVLVTTRECLRIYGEQEYPVTPLAQDSAVELFVQRATAVRPGFSLCERNESLIREICSRLDGLPLAIELAAARIKVVQPEAMLERLQSPLLFLTSGAVDLPQRQRTLRNTIDWSYSLLTEPEQKLFRRLAVFIGGCTAEAAEAVCNTNQDLGFDSFEGLTSLVDKNLLQISERPGIEPRFYLLETIREYALERLETSGERHLACKALAAYCLVLAEEGNPEMSPTDRIQWLTRCDDEIDNFRSALDFLFQGRDLEWGLRLCASLFRFWDMREHLAEGRERLEQALRLAGDHYTRERARLSQFLGALTTAQGDFKAAEQYLRQGLQLYEDLDDDWGIAASLNALAVSERDRGEYAAAQANFERSLACWRLLPDNLAVARCLHNLANVVRVRGDYPRARWALQEAAEIFEKEADRSGAAWSINQLGDVAREQGDLTGAGKFYRRALSVFRESGDRWGSARSLADLGYIDCKQGDFTAARDEYREALEIFANLGHRRGIARVLEGSACLALEQKLPQRALKLAGAAARIRDLMGAPLMPADKEELNRSLRPAWELVPESEAAHAWREGSAMSVERAVEFCLEQTHMGKD